MTMAHLKRSAKENMREVSPTLGPRLSDEHFARFADISAEAFGVYEAAVAVADFDDPLVFFYSRLGYSARSTSSAIRLLASWDTTIPAIALGRVRLEQIVVTSFLIHEDTEVALTPYHHDPKTLRDVLLPSAEFYGILGRWRDAFLAEWNARTKERPNQAPEPTALIVTPPAAQEPRQ